MEVERIKQGGHPRKIWWNCIKEDTKRFGVCKRMLGFRGRGERKSVRKRVDPGSPWNTIVLHPLYRL